MEEEEAYSGVGGCLKLDFSMQTYSHLGFQQVKQRAEFSCKCFVQSHSVGIELYLYYHSPVWHNHGARSHAQLHRTRQQSTLGAHCFHDSLSRRKV